jgi:hypothetical protein
MGAPAPPLLRHGAIWGAICLALAADGCVLPVGPEFQDPSATQNFDPRILDSDPALGARVTGGEFHVTVQDPNPGDNLYVRFVADYPPLSGNTRFVGDKQVPHNPDGQLLSKDVEVVVTCAMLAKLPTHQVTVIVADREFLLDATSAIQPAEPTRLPADAQRTIGSWTLDMECK